MTPESAKELRKERGTVLKGREGVVRQSASHDMRSYSMNFQAMSLYANIPWHTVSSSSLCTLCFPKWQSQWVGGLEGGREEIKSDSLHLDLTSAHPCGDLFLFAQVRSGGKLSWAWSICNKSEWIMEKKSERRKCLEIWFNHTADTIFTWLWFCKRTANAYHILNEQSLPSEDANIEMWIMNGNVIQSSDLVSCWVGCSCQTIATCESWLIRFYFLFFSRSRFWWFKLQ